ncbi:MAG: AAA family ATPase [Anaerolineales bacterium]|nr:AAA family ATPase [Anaerolineales bacterium]
MSNRLTGLQVKNFRSLADVTIETKPLNILFGPNGAGKSTLLDTIWFIRDCAIRGVDLASSERSHGIGVLWDGADEGANISIKLETELAEYEVLFGYSSGRIEPFVGEILFSKNRNLRLIDRKIGSDKADFYHTKMQQSMSAMLREPEKLALTKYLDFEDSSFSASELDRLLHFVHFYHSREAELYGLKKHGSESTHHTWLWERCQNLWSVLRNLHDRRSTDERYDPSTVRYDTIVNFMQESFPSFDDLFIEQTGPNAVYCSFLEKKRRHPIQASGVSDGHLQMLINLTALFSEGKDRDSLIIFDEPETSLHPHALSILAKAIKFATEEWNKQVFIATHSPVLLSQFEPENILAAEIDESGQTVMNWVSEMDEIKDLLEQYATGALYMAEVVAAQSRFQGYEIDAVLSKE